MTNKEKELIADFIENNNLDFSGSGSSLNGNCCILGGYANYLEIEVDELCNTMKELGYDSEVIEELDTVATYAESKSYGIAWEDGNYNGFIYPLKD